MEERANAVGCTKTVHVGQIDQAERVGTVQVVQVALGRVELFAAWRTLLGLGRV